LSNSSENELDLSISSQGSNCDLFLATSPLSIFKKHLVAFLLSLLIIEIYSLFLLQSQMASLQQRSNSIG